MSYILDALKKADAERERGAVPGLHARQVATPLAPSASGGRNGLWLTFVVCVVVGGLGTYWWNGQTASNPAVVAVSAPAVLLMPPPPAPRATALPAKPEVRTPSAKVVASSAKATVAPQPAATPAPLLSELPEDLRRQIPAININGSVYSDNPAQRLLLVNGLVLNQGSTVAPDLTVVEIHTDSSEFSFRGTRFRLAH